MADSGKRVDVQRLLSLGDDLIGVLNNKKDSDGLMKSLEGAKMLCSACRSDSAVVRNLLEDCEKRIKACKEEVDRAKSETIADAELERLENELEDKLHMERLIQQEISTTINDELGALDRQRVSIEERKETIKQNEKDLQKAQDLLSMCASVTSIIPDLDDRSMISGYIVAKDKKKVEKFEFGSTESPFEVCNRLWKMV